MKQLVLADQMIEGIVAKVKTEQLTGGVTNCNNLKSDFKVESDAIASS
jgi:hypothetical protein